MKLLEELEKLGVDVKEGLGRVMDDESLYVMMLDMFISAVEDSPIRPEDFDAGGDLSELIGRIHTLKGTTGNLSLYPLFTDYTETLNLLREGRPGDAKAAFVKMLPAQADIIDCIRRYKEL